MSVSSIIVSLIVAYVPKTELTAADAVTLRDGKVVLGQVIEPAPPGVLLLVVRREWAKNELPEWTQRWRAAEEPMLRRAQRQRRDRLISWRRERIAKPAGQDRILAWIDKELARMSNASDLQESTLMIVRLSRREIRSVKRRSIKSRWMLRLGWQSGFSHVESMLPEALEQSLEGRGFAFERAEPVSIVRLLPILPENEMQWLARRAATEVSNDSGLRFLRYQNLVLDEPAPGQPPNVGVALSTLSRLGQLLDDTSTDPLTSALRGVAVRGRVGAVVTRLELDPGLASVLVKSTLWVRRSQDRWVPSSSRSARIRPADLGPRAGEHLAGDPQIQAVFNIFESIGLGRMSDDLQQRSLNIGAATEKALGLARSALNEDLSNLALPLFRVDRRGVNSGETP